MNSNQTNKNNHAIVQNNRCVSRYSDDSSLWASIVDEFTESEVVPCPWAPFHPPEINYALDDVLDILNSSNSDRPSSNDSSSASDVSYDSSSPKSLYFTKSKVFASDHEANEPPLVSVPCVDPRSQIDKVTISSLTPKSTTTLDNLPDRLEYPKNLIPLDAPIQKSSSKRRLERDSSSSDESAKRMKNTLSARASRARKAARINYLEQKVKDLEKTVQEQQVEIMKLKLQSLNSLNSCPTFF